MKRLIDKSTLVAEIERRISLFKKEKKTEKWSAGASQMNVISLGARIAMLEEILSFLDTIEEIEMNEPNIPKHSYFETIYHCGSEPRWKVGDILAVYEFYRDYEGEEVFGKVIDVYKDEEDDDWVYVFEGEGGGALCERELVSDEAYRKN